MLHPFNAASNAYFFVTVSSKLKRNAFGMTARADCHGWRGAFREIF
jgi:hypothetical protein